ncbi:MAG: metal ABC transporter solute-binding protein, Zn/Mn family [Bacteroidota bacterium]
MKNRIFLIALTLVNIVFWGCNPQEKEKNVVSVSIPPLSYFIDRLTDNSLDVNIMVPDGASHATYSPTTRQMQKLSDSGVFFQIGYLGYEKAFQRNLNNLNPDMVVVNLSDNVQLIRGPEIDHGDHVHEGGIDPHIWMSPSIMLKLLPALKNTIIANHQDLKDVVEQNYTLLYNEVEQVHQEFVGLGEEIQNKGFMIFHPALTYTARDYGLTQIPIEHEGKEPSPSQLREIIRKGQDIPVVFIQKEYDIRNARIIAEETGAEIVQINPMDYNWMESMNQIKEAFKKYLL